MNTHRKSVARTEPVVTAGSISALVSAVLALAVVLGLSLPEGFEAALLAVIAAAAPLVAGLIARRYVTPNGSVVEREDHGEVLAGEGHDTITPGEKIRDVHGE